MKIVNCLAIVLMSIVSASAMGCDPDVEVCSGRYGRMDNQAQDLLPPAGTKVLAHRGTGHQRQFRYEVSYDRGYMKGGENGILHSDASDVEAAQRELTQLLTKLWPDAKINVVQIDTEMK